VRAQSRKRASAESVRIAHSQSALGKPRHIVSPWVIEVIIQEDGWKQAEFERSARSEALDDLPGV